MGPLGPDEFLPAFEAAKQRSSGTVLVIDADQFSTVKAEHGEAAIAEAMQLIERVIRSSVRADDLVGRIDGRKFAIYLWGADASVSQQIATRICESVEDTIFLASSNQIAKLTVSVGGAPTQAGRGAASEIELASNMLAEAHAVGGGTVRLAAGNGGAGR